jgi:hypothetical protein
MKIEEHDVVALKALGYSEDEARFLYIVASHSGYFVPRQFDAFTGTETGTRAARFGQKIESRGHACWRQFQDMGRVYHLFSKALYYQIGKQDLHTRTTHSPEFVKTRLILLDFILANREHDYLETEQQKVRYFCEHLGLRRKSLPAKSYQGSLGSESTLRYFVDKFPLFLDSSGSVSSPIVTFSFVDPGHRTIKPFATHLDAYDPLFCQLSEFRLLYISSSTANFKKAHACFSRRNRSMPQEILDYFRLRKAWDLKKYALFSNDQIEKLNAGARQFQGEHFEALYSAWSSDESRADTIEREFAQIKRGGQVDFIPCLINGPHCDPHSWKKEVNRRHEQETQSLGVTPDP